MGQRIGSNVDDYSSLIPLLGEASKTPIIAGVTGVILSVLRPSPGTVTIRDRAFSFIAGVACILFVAPAVSENMSIFSKLNQVLLFFFTGLIGINLLIKIMDASKKLDLLTLLAKFWKILELVKAGLKNDTPG